MQFIHARGHVIVYEQRSVDKEAFYEQLSFDDTTTEEPNINHRYLQQERRLPADCYTILIQGLTV